MSADIDNTVISSDFRDTCTIAISSYCKNLITTLLITFQEHKGGSSKQFVVISSKQGGLLLEHSVECPYTKSQKISYDTISSSFDFFLLINLQMIFLF